MSTSVYVQRFGALCRATFERGGVNMSRYGNGCGSPGCLLGNYADRSDLQDEFELSPCRPDDDHRLVRNKLSGCVVGCQFAAIQNHFGIDSRDAHDLFSSTGCSEAFTDLVLAVSYVRVFVAERFGTDPYPEAGPLPQWGGRGEAEASGRRRK